VSSTDRRLSMTRYRLSFEGMSRKDLEDSLHIADEYIVHLRTLRLREDWDESDGVVLWWTLPLREPPYVGDLRDDDFPEYVTHWTPIPTPDVEGGRES
jgi:hypothetical protein